MWQFVIIACWTNIADVIEVKNYSIEWHIVRIVPLHKSNLKSNFVGKSAAFLYKNIWQ